MTIRVRGSAALIIAATVIGVTLIWLPAYRWFFLISIGIGVLIAIGIHLWHNRHPVHEEGEHNKRPLGLS